jgi:hypothetical protein
MKNEPDSPERRWAMEVKRNPLFFPITLLALPNRFVQVASYCMGLHFQSKRRFLLRSQSWQAYRHSGT